MGNHWKKIIAPVVVVLGLIIFNVRIVLLLLRTSPLPTTIVAMGLIVPVIVTVILVVVLVERIREIRRGEEDDLSNY